MYSKQQDIPSSKSGVIKSITKHQVDIAALKEREKQLLAIIKTLENLVPVAVVWYMWRFAVASRTEAESRFRIEQEARQTLSRLLMAIEELKKEMEGITLAQDDPLKDPARKVLTDTTSLSDDQYQQIDPSLKPGSHVLMTEPEPTKIGKVPLRKQVIEKGPKPMTRSGTTLASKPPTKERSYPRKLSNEPSNSPNDNLSGAQKSPMDVTPTSSASKRKPPRDVTPTSSASKRKPPSEDFPHTNSLPTKSSTGPMESSDHPVLLGAKKDELPGSQQTPMDVSRTLPVSRRESSMDITSSTRKRSSEDQTSDMAEGSKSRTRVVREVIEIQHDGKPPEKYEIPTAIDAPQAKAVEDLILRLDRERDQLQEEMDRIFGPLPEAVGKPGKLGAKRPPSDSKDEEKSEPGDTTSRSGGPGGRKKPDTEDEPESGKPTSRSGGPGGRKKPDDEDMDEPESGKPTSRSRSPGGRRVSYTEDMDEPEYGRPAPRGGRQPDRGYPEDFSKPQRQQMARQPQDTRRGSIPDGEAIRPGGSPYDSHGVPYGQRTPGQGSPYDQGAQGQRDPYNQGAPGQRSPYDQGAPGQRSPYGQGTPGQGSPYGRGKPGEGGPYGQQAAGQGPPYRPGTPGQGPPYGQGTPGQGPQYGRGTPGQGSPYGQQAPGQGSPYGQKAPGQGSPYDQGAPGQGPPYGQKAPGQGSPYDQGAPGQGSPYDQGAESTQPRADGPAGPPDEMKEGIQRIEARLDKIAKAVEKVLKDSPEGQDSIDSDKDQPNFHEELQKIQEKVAEGMQKIQEIIDREMAQMNR